MDGTGVTHNIFSFVNNPKKVAPYYGDGGKTKKNKKLKGKSNKNKLKKNLKKKTKKIKKTKSKK